MWVKALKAKTHLITAALIHTAKPKAALLVLLFLCAPLAVASEQKPLHIFAAASLAAAMEPISQAYLEAHGQKVLLSYGASSTLSRQISYGAPANIFISANPRWMQTLVDNKLISAQQNRALLHNKLLLVAPADSPLESTGHLPSAEQLQDWLLDSRLAVGDPQHVPVGLYAAKALKAAGLWQILEPRLAPTEDARASLALLQRSEVALGIVYQSDLATAPDLKQLAELPLPEGERISYPAAVITDDTQGSAERFMTFLRSSLATALFVEMGFSPAS